MTPEPIARNVDAGLLAARLADIVETALTEEEKKLAYLDFEVFRTTPRTTIVRVHGEPELTFEITVRRRW